MGSGPAPRRAPLGRRTRLILAATAAFALGWWFLGLAPGGLVPRAAGLDVLAGLAKGALRPALERQGDASPGSPPLLVDVALVAWRTIAFATLGMALAVLLALPLTVAASDAFWERVSVRGGFAARAGGMIRQAARTLAALLRSVHELLWAVLFLSAFGAAPATGVIAIALPYAGTLARIWSEMIDESAGSPARALRGLGAGAASEFLFGRVSMAARDVSAYAFYRYECALRSAAVLGFFGYETLGLRLQTTFAHVEYREFWTYLYALIALVLVFEAVSVRLRMARRPNSADTEPRRGPNIIARVDASHPRPPEGGGNYVRPRTRFGIRARYPRYGIRAIRSPRSPFKAAVLLTISALLACSLAFGGLAPGELFEARRRDNLERFLSKLVPEPLREGGGAAELGTWFLDLLRGGAGAAALQTVALAVVATYLAAAAALVLAPLGDRRLASRDPYLDPRPSRPRVAVAWAARTCFVLARAVPEYLLAFVALAALGRSAWAPIVALAVHNAGILARLEADVLENLRPGPLSALRQLGGGRRQIVHLAAEPMAAGRFLSFASYRLETCVRESVALGLLGTLTLGYVAGEARARRDYDEFAAVLAIGAALVLASDLAARAARRWIGERIARMSR